MGSIQGVHKKGHRKRRKPQRNTQTEVTRCMGGVEGRHKKAVAKCGESQRENKRESTRRMGGIKGEVKITATAKESVTDTVVDTATDTVVSKTTEIIAETVVGEAGTTVAKTAVNLVKASGCRDFWGFMVEIDDVHVHVDDVLEAAIMFFNGVDGFKFYWIVNSNSLF
ncbi:hypothetical protein Sjap_008722 [Stephania japonica]|uniref:Uncharacterized protein n=1 Tax=Stephania japonica TaxID=461633 RepID=A0AAP0PB52_9MAGN